MDASGLFAPAAVFAGVPVNGKKAAFQFLGAQAERLWALPADAVVAALAARERLGSTGFGGGAAIPHGRVAGLDRMVGAVLRPAHPLSWDALDGAPVGLVVMLLGPEEAGADHLKALARVSRMLRDRALMAKLLGARDAGAIWSLLAADVGADTGAGAAGAHAAVA